MSFASELSTIMNANVAINNSVDGIYRDTTSTEFNAKKNWVIYTYKRGSGIGTLSDKDAIKVYNLYVEIYTSQASLTESISDAIRTYLTGYTSTTFRDISFLNETHSNLADTNNNVAYITLLEFEILFES
jgi:hypothetical protein